MAFRYKGVVRIWRGFGGDGGILCHFNTPGEAVDTLGPYVVKNDRKLVTHEIPIMLNVKRIIRKASVEPRMEGAPDHDASRGITSNLRPEIQQSRMIKSATCLGKFKD